MGQKTGITATKQTAFREGISDHVFILCAMLGFRFCPRLRDLPDRKLACIEPATAYKDRGSGSSGTESSFERDAPA